MNKSVQKEWEVLEIKTKNLIQNLQSVPEEKLVRQPAPGAWSPLQVVQHLMIAEELSEKYMRKKLSFNKPVPKAGFKGAARFRVMKIFNWIGFKIKAPSALTLFPENLRLEELKKSWASQRDALYQYLESLPDETLQGELFKHILAGKMNARHMVGFFSMHLDRHRKQIERSTK